MNFNFMVDTNGRRISDRAIKKGLKTTIVSGMLSYGWWTMSQGITLTLFLEALRASGVLMGLITTISQLSCAFQIIGALFAGHLSSRKQIWGPALLCARAIWIFPVLISLYMTGHPFAASWCIILVVVLSSILTHGATAFWYSWMSDLLPERIRGKFWGSYQTWTMTVYLLSMLAAGRILDFFPSPRDPGGSWTGFTTVFGIAVVLGVVAIFIQLRVPEPARKDIQKERNLSLKRLIAPLRESNYRKLTVSMGVCTFSLGIISLGLIYLRKDFSVTYSQLAAITSISSLGMVAFGMIWGYVMDRVGGRAVGILTIMLAPLCVLPWFFVKNYQTNIFDLVNGVWIIGPLVEGITGILPNRLSQAVAFFTLPQPIWIFSITSFVGGALYGAIGVCQFSLLSRLAPEKDKTLAMAVHWATVGVIGSFGSVLAGRVMDYFAAHPVHYVFATGTTMSFHHFLVIAHMLIMWLVVLPIFSGIRRQGNEPTFGRAFSRLVMGNPIRAATNIYIMSSSVTRRKRANAVKKLGKDRTEIAVSDLIEKLDDPSSEVREESAAALGSIGSAEAVDALVAKLEDPHSDLSPQIAKALRSAKHPKSVEALVRKLSDPDRETLTESARTLGEIGDRRAVSSLLELLSSTNDDKVISASSEALARLGEIAAIYEILPRMWNTGNPVLRGSLAVAVGDLLGERDGFYKVLSREQDTRGQEVVRLLKDLRKKMRNACDTSVRDQCERLITKTREIENLYESHKGVECVQALFYLSLGIAAIRWCMEFGGDSKAFVNELIWRDQHFGIGVWFLDLLRKHCEENPDTQVNDMDILLGVYFLACAKITGGKAVEGRGKTSNNEHPTSNVQVEEGEKKKGEN